MGAGGPASMSMSMSVCSGVLVVPECIIAP